MTDLFFTRKRIFRTLSLCATSTSSSSSIPGAASLSISSEDSISSSDSEDEEKEGKTGSSSSLNVVDEDVDENDVGTEKLEMGPMNPFASASSLFQNNQQQQGTTISSKQQHSNQHQPYPQSHSPLLDIEEATPPATSQRLDQSRRRGTSISNNNHNSGSNIASSDEHHNQHLVIGDDNEIKAVIGKPSIQVNSRSSIPQAPLSCNNALGIISLKKGSSAVEPRLAHPLLEKLPLQFRFIVTGLLSNILFMILYNGAVSLFIQKTSATTIYSIVYLIFIPISHFMTILLVFGWPDHYLHSLASNLPIGLTAIGIGSMLTSYLDLIKFNQSIEEYIYDNWTFSKMPGLRQEFSANEKSEFYSSLLVLVVTSIWTYILSLWINSYPTKSDKKEQ